MVSTLWSARVFVFSALTSAASMTSNIFSVTRVGRRSTFFVTFYVPSMLAITSGTPAFCAILKLPEWNGSIAVPWLRVPSG